MTAARLACEVSRPMLVLKPNGMEIDRIVGYLPPVEFVTRLSMRCRESGRWRIC